MNDNKKDDKVYFVHILENIEKIENSFKGTSKKDYESNVDLQDATFRRLEIIGEAVKNVSNKTKAKYPLVKWAKIAGTRDRLIHGYASIDRDIIYK